MSAPTLAGLVRAMACVMLLSAARAHAQTPDTPRHSAPLWELTPFVGVGQPARAGPSPYASGDLRKVLLGVHAVGIMFHGTHWSLAYAADVLPLVVVTNDPKAERAGPRPASTQASDRGPVVGAAIAPIGAEVQFSISRRWTVYGNGDVGTAWFTRDVPVPHSRAFNYTATIAAGAQWRWRGGAALRVGYMRHHLSNAGTGENNPGLNGHILTVGIVRTIGRR